VYVYYGSGGGLPASPSATLTSPTTTATTFGHAIAAAGDVDGDGYADLVVDAPAVNATDPVAVVYTGGESGIDVSAFKYALATPSSQQSWSVAIATDGDLNGDAIADIVVAGNYTYIYDGSSTGTLGSAMSPTKSVINFDNWPEAISTAADLDGNGYADLLEDGANNDNLISTKGVFEFYSFGYPLTKNTTLVSDPKTDQNDFQAAFCTGNFDGTGPVIAVGSLGSYVLPGSIGYVYLFKPNATLPFATWTSPTPATGQTFGTGVATVGDLNADGYDDLAVGEPFGGTANAGNVYLLYGSTSGLNASVSVTLANPQTGQSGYENFGIAFAH
jgi:hypothetical protein